LIEKSMEKLLNSLYQKKVTPQDAMEQLKTMAAEDIGVASVDHHRHMRQGFPEVIYCAGKTEEEVAAIARAILKRSKTLLATRADKKIYARVRKIHKSAIFHPRSGAITVGGGKEKTGEVLVVSAGTSDLAVAEEVVVTADIMGSRVVTVFDVGVAGIHRLFAHMEKLGNARVIVVVAGMDGALASVVGGLTSRPVIAVPTSVGYGAAMGGLSALLAMLNSCASGVGVMNIDNGFGAGALAHKINTLPEKILK